MDKQDQPLLDLLFEANCSLDGWMLFTNQFCKHFNLRSSHLYIIHTETMDIRFQETAGKIPTEQDYRRYMEEYINHDVFQQYFMSQPIGSYYATNLLPDDIHMEGRKSKMYLEWAQPQGIEQACAAIHFIEPPWACIFHHTRSIEQGEFTETEIQRLNSFVPYIEKAIKQRIQLAEQFSHKQHIQSMLNSFQLPVALLNEFGEITTTNQLMDSLLQDASTPIRSSQLPYFELDDEQTSKLLNLAISQTISDAKGFDLGYDNDPIPLNSTISIGLNELIEQEDNGQFFVGALAYIYNPEYIATTSKNQIKSLFKLTDAESDVCHLLAQGYQVKTIAHKLDKSVETVREQLKSCISKANVKNQLALINLLSGLPKN